MRLTRIMALVPPACFWLACGSEAPEPTAALGEQYTVSSYEHVADGTKVDYVSNPPCIGSHYGSWLAWGEHASVAAEQYVHNLEHGGIAILYDCDEACPELAASLKTYAESVAPDDGGAFRWILAPFSGMPARIAVVSWGWVYRSDALSIPEIEAFVAAHYRKAPEDVALSGAHM